MSYLDNEEDFIACVLLSRQAVVVFNHHRVPLISINPQVCLQMTLGSASKKKDLHNTINFKSAKQGSKKVLGIVQVHTHFKEKFQAQKAKKKIPS